MASAWLSTWTSPAPLGERMTVVEWGMLSEDQDGELVDNRLAEEEVPDPVHELCVTWLTTLFRIWLRGRGGFVFGSEVKLRVSDGGGRKADAVMYLPGGKSPPRRGLLTLPPDVVVEVVTPTPRDERRDRVDKMAEYESFGVKSYWLLDPALGSLEIFDLTDQGKYIRAVAATAGRIDQVPRCPGLTVDLDELWAELARLESEEADG